MKSKLLTIALTCACAGLARADFNPVPLTESSFTFDTVVESNTAPAVPYCINATAGGGTSMGDNSYYEQGMVARPGEPSSNSGIPYHNTVFTSINNTNLSFVMPPTYLTNNTLMIDSTFGSGSFTFNTPTTATNLAILGAGCGGGTTIGYTVTHTDSTTETGSISFPDWFNGGTATAWGANGRMDTSGNYNNFNNSSVNNNAPYLYAIKIPVSGAAPIANIAFTFTTGAHANILAVSGNAGGSAWTPIPVGGFNVMAIIPSAFPLTATMDQGTNTGYNGNLATWFEQGYVSNAPSAGLPPSGTTFNSFSQPTHHYQFASYTTNNAILIDQGHQIANITPVNPTAFYAYAFLTAGGNIGGGTMTNVCILQHADGVNETNLFFGYDWFNNNNAGALALKANGRVNMANRTVNNVNNGYPYLFETYFALNDTASPVTNIVVMYKTSPGANSTTYIMAVSASDVPVPPVITSGPLPASQAWFTNQTATFSVQVSGTAPVTNSWLVESNGIYVPLKDGVDANGSTVSGSGTTTLTISGITLADATNYEFTAANAISSVTSSPATLKIKGLAGLVPIAGWNNIDNAHFLVGNSTNIYASDGSSSATLTLNDAGVNNAWNSGITGNGADLSLMHGYIDAGANNGLDAIATISGLTGSSYNVYIYCFPDQTRPNNSGDGLPNYNVNGTTYYAPLLGGNGSSSYDATSTSVGGKGFNGFVSATTFTTNDFNQDVPASAFGNYIEIPNVAVVGGQIAIQAGADATSYRSPLNGIELVSTTDGTAYGINFLGSTTDPVSDTPGAPVIASQSPATPTINVLTNHVVSSTLSVTVDASSPSSAPPFAYQWYDGATPIAGATSSSYVNVDTNDGASIYCVVTNFVGSATSSPVAITLYSKPALTAYQSAIFAYNPLSYWPLTETNGNVAFDYAGTNDGVYNGNYTLGQPGLPPTVGIGDNTSAGFDGTNAYVDIPVGNLNVTGAVTVIEWVQPPSGGDTGFTTPLGHSDDSYRFDVAGGQPHWADSGPDIVSSQTINDGNWHQLVGVYDGTNQYLYVDGQMKGTPQAGAPAGSTGDVWIGGAPDYAGQRNFAGNIAQVAILPTALTPAQVSAVYSSMGVPPSVTITPANPSVYAGISLTLTAQLTGSAATSLQWYSIDTLNNSNNIPGATNLTYTIDNTPIELNGYTYGINVANDYGATNASVVLSVVNGPAYLQGDISPLSGEAYVGAPVTYSIDAEGSLPIYYQWIVDGTPVPGATNAIFTLPAACGTHTIQASFTNDQSAGSAIMSSQAVLQGDADPTNITFGDGTGWQLNTASTGVPTLVGGVLTLTDGNGGEADDAFYTVPQYVGSFTASFTYQVDTVNNQADGAAFIIQNSLNGASALGGGGGGLGYLGISNSVALEFNLYPGNGEIIGIAQATNGNTYASGGAEYQPPGPVQINSGDPIDVTVNFANGVLSVFLMDTATAATYSTNYVFGPLPAILNGSNLGYIGFSGGDGGATSIQRISNFQFNSAILPPALTVSAVTNNSFGISWPADDPNYVLQMTSSLTSPSWIAGPTPTAVNGVNQVTVNVNGGSQQQFYRLVRIVNCP